MVAAKETMNLLATFSSFKYGLSFNNYADEMNNYSVSFGMQMLGLDVIIYFAIGCALESLVFLYQYLMRKRHVKQMDKQQEEVIKEFAASVNGGSEQSRIIEGSTKIHQTGLQFVDVQLTSDIQEAKP